MPNNNIDMNILSSGLETVKNVAKVAANLSEKDKQKPKQDRKPWREGDNLNQPHNQTVEVKVGQQETERKPMIVKDVKETHVHKHFPDNRALTPEECEIEKLRVQYEHEKEIKELEYRILLDKEDRYERKERERYEREQRERRERLLEKRRKRNGIIAGGVVAIGLGALAYSIYTDSRDARAAGPALLRGQEPAASVNAAAPAIEVDGSVK